MRLGRAGFEPSLTCPCRAISEMGSWWASRQVLMHSGRPHRTAQIRRELTLWRGGSHGRAEIFALPSALAQLTFVVSKPYPRANHSQKRFASATLAAVLRIA